MPVFDFECPKCGTITERIQPYNRKTIKCPGCGASAGKIITTSKVNTANEDAEWIRSVREVVEKNSGKPHAEEFLKNPTRTNLKNWMDKEKLRHLEPGEGERDRKPWKPDGEFTQKMMKRYQERNAINIYR